MAPMPQAAGSGTDGNARPMDDAQLLRYSRHILLPEFGLEAQEKLVAAHALVIGAGGLGAPVAQFLVAAGVGTLTLCDAGHGRPHEPAAADPLRDAGCRRAEGRRRQGAARRHQPGSARRGGAGAGSGRPSWRRSSARADVVLDCSDNFATRHAVNRACVAAKTPLVSGAAIRFDGQVAVFDPRDPASPCYHCLFGEGEELEETRCAIMGVFAPVVGIVGATQAAEALKLIGGVGEPMTGRLLLLDAYAMRWRDVRIPRDPQCPVCGSA